MPKSPSLGGVSVPSLPKLGRTTKAKKIPKKMAENFWPTCFFCRNNLKFGNLPNSFINFDQLLTVYHWLNDVPSRIGSRPRI